MKIDTRVILTAALAMFFALALVPNAGAADQADQADRPTATIDGLTGPSTPEGVTDREIDSIQLAKEVLGIGNRRLRARRVTVEPGGIVPIHSHEDRPAMIYVLAGTIFEHRSDRDEPVRHEAGGLSIEADVAHWWENRGETTVELVATDIFHQEGEDGDAPDTGTRPRQKPLDGPKSPVGETEKLLGSIDLERQIRGLSDRELRLRLVTVEPGGIAPVHSHQGRPALFYILSSEITEHRSDELGSVVHRAGDVTKAEDGVSHWWKNSSEAEVGILVTDVFKSN